MRFALAGWVASAEAAAPAPAAGSDDGSTLVSP